MYKTFINVTHRVTFMILSAGSEQQETHHN